MVKLKVIKGGKPQPPACIPEVRLCSAYSLVDNFHGHDGVKLNWIYLNRTKPVGAFEHLINNYRRTDKTVRTFLEHYVMELFTSEEAEKLRSYLLQTQDIELHIHEESLPVSGGPMPMPYRQAPLGTGRGFYHLPEPDRRLLPFEVCAYYDVSACPPSIEIQRELKERGAAYLEEAVRLLGLPLSSSRGQIEAVVEALYDRHGFYVGSGGNREDRLKEKEEFLRRMGPPHTDGP